ncbi:pilus assembly protein PilM [Candidatus Saccharibacteria bacterium]|jgi:type IV pilus assembly protein PilM|nr:pilus assembly protein PilM [Candidatus Saccharibacteria bacterium]
MKLNQAVGEFFALDIGTTAIRVVQLVQRSSSEWGLLKFAVTPIDPRLVESTAVTDVKRLGDAILATVQAAGIVTKNIAVGLPSNKVFSTVIEMDEVPKQELANNVLYNAESYIPGSSEDAKIDWSLLGASLSNPKRIEVLIASVSNEYIEKKMEFIESLGFNLIAFEPDAVAVTRAVLPKDITSNHMIIDVGDSATDIIVTVGAHPRLLRSIPFGFRSFIKNASNNIGITQEEAEQYLLKYGFNQEAMDGQLYKSIHTIIEQFVGEFEKTTKYLAQKYPNLKLDSALLSGHSVLIPGFGDLVNMRVGLTPQFATPWQNVVVPPENQQQLAPISAQFGVVIGLGERGDH